MACAVIDIPLEFVYSQCLSMCTHKHTPQRYQFGLICMYTTQEKKQKFILFFPWTKETLTLYVNKINLQQIELLSWFFPSIFCCLYVILFDESPYKCVCKFLFYLSISDGEHIQNTNLLDSMTHLNCCAVCFNKQTNRKKQLKLPNPYFETTRTTHFLLSTIEKHHN